MDSTALRVLQAPLKTRCRDDPASARTSLSASGALAEPVVTAEVGDVALACLARLARAADRYCVVSQSLREVPRIVVLRRGSGDP